MKTDNYVDNFVHKSLYYKGKIELNPEIIDQINQLLGSDENEIGNFETIKGFSVDNILKRLPKGSEVRVQYDERGLLLIDPTGAITIRIYGPSYTAPKDSNARGGWVARARALRVRANRPLSFNYVVEQLFDFASLEYQDRYIVHGTEDHFMLLEDIINDFYMSNNERSLNNRNNQLEITPTEENILNEFSNFLKEMADGSDKPIWQAYYAGERKKVLQRQNDPKLKQINEAIAKPTDETITYDEVFDNEETRTKFLQDFILNDPSWIMIRQKAQEYLQELGVNLKELENRYIDRSKVIKLN